MTTELEQMTARQKVAAFLIAVGPDKAATVLAFMDETEVEAVAQEISRLGRVPSATLDGVMEQFYADAISGNVNSVGGIDYARTLLESWRGGRSEEMIQRLLDAAQNRPFGFLAQFEADHILQFIIDEHPQTVSLVISHLPTTLGAKILANLPKDLQCDVAVRVARLEPASPDVIRSVEISLRTRLGNVTGADLSSGAAGAEGLADLLNTTDRTTEKNILGHLADADPDLAEEVRTLMFIFEDIVGMSDKDLQETLRTVDTKELALALKGVKYEVKDAVFRNLSERATQSLQDEIEFLGPVKVSEVEAAQTSIVAVIRRLEEEGRVTMRAGADGGFIE
ncbi:MAG: flagellar motor switch protein FliG [Actinomycetia bacterium]|nr:flagellar motor switch protein FliG [Actinomycetes bacterium]MCP4960871.1 flagellar motor switch protein FliG [Actinomycetes bacterium]